MSVFEQVVLDTEPIRYYRQVASGDLVDRGSDGVDLTVSGGLSNDGFAPLVSGDALLPLKSGSGKFVEASTAETPSTFGDMTLMAIVQITTAPGDGNTYRILHANSATSTTASANNCRFSLSAKQNSGTINLVYFHESGSGTDAALTFTDTELTVGVAHHVVLVRDATAKTVTPYVDGVAYTPVGYSTNPDGGANAQLAIGYRLDGLQRLLGHYDAIGIWDAALTAGQVTRIWDAATGKPGSLISAEATKRYTLHPAQRGIYHDGKRYWVFYPSGTTLKCAYGTTLDDLTDDSTGLPDDLASEGMAYSIECGIYDGAHRVWILASKTTAGDGLILYTAELTAEGLGTIASRNISRAPVTFAIPRVQRSFAAGAVSDIFAANMERDDTTQGDSVVALRRFEPDASADTDGGEYDPTGPGSCNHAMFVALSDGYIALATDSGDTLDSGHEGTRAATMATIGGTQSEGGLVHTDQAYASSATPYHHATTSAVVQLIGNGDIWLAYKDDTDASGRWGKITLSRRGGSIGEEWEEKRTNLVEDSVWHLAMTQTSDGSKLVLVYNKNATGDTRGQVIYGRIFDVATGELGAEVEVANVTPGRLLDVLALPPACEIGKIPLAWSEHEGSIDGGTGSGGNTWIQARDIAGDLGESTKIGGTAQRQSVELDPYLEATDWATMEEVQSSNPFARFIVVDGKFYQTHE